MGSWVIGCTPHTTYKYVRSSVSREVVKIAGGISKSCLGSGGNLIGCGGNHPLWDSGKQRSTGTICNFLGVEGGERSGKEPRSQGGLRNCMDLRNKTDCTE
jgi:hypothetical protein